MEQLNLFDKSEGLPMMPEEYKGKQQSKTEYTKTSPRSWTKEEIKWILDLKSKGYSNSDIALSVGRTEVSIQIKLKRLSKSNNTYNKKHLNDKYHTNKLFIDYIKPKTILDLYAGEKPFYDNLGDEYHFDTTTNDKNVKFPTMYHMDSLVCLCNLFAQGKKYDMIDLDPYGSAYDCFDLAMKMAKKGVVITFGEYGHKRWKRNDFLNRFYGVTDVINLKPEDLIDEVQKIALRNKKKLTVVYQKEWQNIVRVWFEISDCKVFTPQIQ